MSKRQVEHKLDQILAQPLTLGSEQRALNLLRMRPHRSRPWHPKYPSSTGITVTSLKAQA
jgi:hypothetical protein